MRKLEDSPLNKWLFAKYAGIIANNHPAFQYRYVQRFLATADDLACHWKIDKQVEGDVLIAAAWLTCMFNWMGGQSLTFASMAAPSIVGDKLNHIEQTNLSHALSQLSKPQWSSDYNCVASKILVCMLGIPVLKDLIGFDARSFLSSNMVNIDDAVTNAVHNVRHNFLIMKPLPHNEFYDKFYPVEVAKLRKDLAGKRNLNKAIKEVTAEIKAELNASKEHEDYLDSRDARFFRAVKAIAELHEV